MLLAGASLTLVGIDPLAIVGRIAVVDVVIRPPRLLLVVAPMALVQIVELAGVTILEVLYLALIASFETLLFADVTFFERLKLSLVLVMQCIQVLRTPGGGLTRRLSHAIPNIVEVDIDVESLRLDQILESRQHGVDHVLE